MSNSLHFNISGTHYEISLKQTERDSIKSVVIGGIKYAIGGQEDAIALFEQKTHGLNLASMKLEELKDRLSILEENPVNSSIAKLNKLGTDVLAPREAANQAIQTQSKQSKVLNELKPTWPIPGSPPTASITDRMKELGVPGVSISVINNGKQEWSQGVGELDKPTTMIQAASISKTITALTVMTLIQEGVKTPKNEPLTLDTNIQDILDEELWKSISNGNKEPITIRQLMSHTAGLEEDTREGYKGYHRLGEIKQEIDQLKDQLIDITKAKEHIEYLESKRDHAGNGSSGRAKKAGSNIQIEAHEKRLEELMNKQSEKIEQLNHLQSTFKVLSADVVKRTDEQISKLQIELEELTKNSQASSSNDKRIIKINDKLKVLRAARKRASKGEMPSLDEIIKGEGTNSPPVRVATNPGSCFAYSGGGAMILQKVIEITAATNNMPNKTYPDIVKEKLFDRLGMKNSEFSPAENRTIQGNGEDGKPLPGQWVQQPELAAAGLWSTPEDLAKVAMGIQKSLLNQEGGIIEQHLVRQMVAPADAILRIKKEILELESKLKTAQRHVKHLKEQRDHVKKGSSGRSKKASLNTQIQFHEERLQKIQAKLDMLRSSPKEIPGLGVFIEQTNEATYFYHSGSNLGFRCLMVANDQGQGAVVMTNSEFGDDLIPEVIRKIAEVYDWKGKDSLNLQFPPLHPEVVETSQKRFSVEEGEQWASNYKGQYISTRGKVVNVEVNKKGEILFRPPNHPTGIKITPVAKHVGIFKENGRWFPIEFTQNKDEPLVLNIHNIKHTKLTQ
jgi:CubicO group peptidase (beta-lactamase class C family)